MEHEKMVNVAKTSVTNMINRSLNSSDCIIMRHNDDYEGSSDIIVYRTHLLNHGNKLLCCKLRKGRPYFFFKDIGDIRRNFISNGGEYSIPYAEVFPFLEVRIKSYEISGKIFGKLKEKEKLFREDKKYLLKDVQINYGTSKKLQDNVYQAVIEDLKFIVGDLEVITPTIPKGFNIPKDKSIKEFDFVYFKKDIHKIPYRVEKIVKNPTSKKVCRRSSNRKLDLLTLKNGFISKKAYIKDVKKIYTV